MKHLLPVGLALVVAAFACQAQRYEIHDIGAAPENRGGAIAVNDKGVAVGWISKSTLPGGQLPAIFSFNGQPDIIYTPGPGRAVGINKHGAVVGYYSESEYTSRGFLWSGNVLSTINGLGGSATWAAAINDKGTVVGASYLPGDYELRPFVYRNGEIRDLGAFGNAGSSSATSINDRGDIVGYGAHYTDPNDWRTFFWRGVRITDGKLQYLNQLTNALYLFPYSINNKGDVAGTLRDEPSANYTAFALIGNTTYRITAGVLGAWANSINDSGQVVGVVADNQLFTSAFVWQKGVLTELIKLPEVQAAGWTRLWDATAINKDGVIVGYGTNAYSGPNRAFMLVPRKRNDN